MKKFLSNKQAEAEKVVKIGREVPLKKLIADIDCSKSV